MIKVFIGELNDFNKYVVDDIIDNYRTPLVHKRSSLDKIEQTISNIKKPIIPTRSLLYVNIQSGDKPKVDMMALNSTLRILEKYENHKYLDIIVVIDRVKGLKDIYSKSEVKVLKYTYKEDMVRYIKKEIYNKYKYNDSACEELARISAYRLRYSFINYNNLRSSLLTQEHLDKNVLNKIIKLEKSIDLNEITYGILFCNKRLIKEYYRACEKYTPKWINKRILSIINRTIKSKIDYRDGKLTMNRILQDDELKKMKPLIFETTITDCYLLKLCFSDKYPIEKYLYNQDNKIGGILDV